MISLTLPCRSQARDHKFLTLVIVLVRNMNNVCRPYNFDSCLKWLYHLQLHEECWLAGNRLSLPLRGKHFRVTVSRPCPLLSDWFLARINQHKSSVWWISHNAYQAAIFPWKLRSSTRFYLAVRWKVSSSEGTSSLVDAFAYRTWASSFVYGLGR